MSEVNDWLDISFMSVFAVLYFGVPALVVWASYRRELSIDLTSLWTHNNRPDKLAVILLGTWWIHSCSMILWTLLRTIKTEDYLTYMGWAIPIIAKMFAPAGPREERFISKEEGKAHEQDQG